MDGLLRDCYYSFIFLLVLFFFYFRLYPLIFHIVSVPQSVFRNPCALDTCSPVPRLSCQIPLGCFVGCWKVMVCQVGDGDGSILQQAREDVARAGDWQGGSGMCQDCWVTRGWVSDVFIFFLDSCVSFLFCSDPCPLELSALFVHIYFFAVHFFKLFFSLERCVFSLISFWHYRCSRFVDRKDTGRNESEEEA